MSRYRKSWTQVLEEVQIFEALKPKDKKVVDAFYDEKEDDQPKANLSSDGKSLWIAGSKAAQWKNGKIEILHAPSGRFDQSVFKYMRKSIPSLNFAKEEVELEESAALQLKMAFDDAKIKIKGVKGGKLVIDKKDKKKVEKVISKQMKDKSAAKRVLGSQIIFEEVEIDEKFAGWIAFYNKQKLEIKPKKGEIDSLNDAKQAAIKHFKVPKSKQGLLAIEPAHEEVDLDEATMPATVDTLKKIVKDKQHQTVKFDKGSAKVDLFSASAMVQVYDALKQPHLKKKFEDMIKSKEGFMQTQAFAFKMAK